jgi:hypothetical protein
VNQGRIIYRLVYIQYINKWNDCSDLPTYPPPLFRILEIHLTLRASPILYSIFPTKFLDDLGDVYCNSHCGGCRMMEKASTDVRRQQQPNDIHSKTNFGCQDSRQDHQVLDSWKTVQV